MILFRMQANGHIEWSEDGGRHWHDQETRPPREVMRAWWQILCAIHRPAPNGSQEDVQYA